MERKMFYEDPTQVQFKDFDNECWVGGIAYHDVIICGCCGGVIELTELYDDANAVGCKYPIIPFPVWCSISEEIIGDCAAAMEDEDEEE